MKDSADKAQLAINEKMEYAQSIGNELEDLLNQKKNDILNANTDLTDFIDARN